MGSVTASAAPAASTTSAAHGTAERSDTAAVLHVVAGSEAALKKAYRRAAVKWHPDKCRVGKQKCEKRMSEAALANQVLADARQLQHWEAWRDDGLKKKRRGHREL